MIPCRLLQSAQNAMAEKMAMHEQYILGMLTNFDEGLPVSRIHNMLKMFVLDGSYDATEAELRCQTSFAKRIRCADTAPHVAPSDAARDALTDLYALAQRIYRAAGGRRQGGV